MSVDNVLKIIQENDIKFVDFRFCDTRELNNHSDISSQFTL
jgi:glutamine synthetase